MAKSFQALLELLILRTGYYLFLELVQHPADYALLGSRDLRLQLLSESLKTITKPTGISESGHVHGVSSKAAALYLMVGQNVPVEAVIVPTLKILRIFKALFKLLY